jgi:hypothetical protein
MYFNSFNHVSAITCTCLNNMLEIPILILLLKIPLVQV